MISIINMYVSEAESSNETSDEVGQVISGPSP